MNDKIQTRSEENGIRNFWTLSDALTHANNNLDVWKISFSTETGERIRLVRKDVPMGDMGTGALWMYEPI